MKNISHGWAEFLRQSLYATSALLTGKRVFIYALAFGVLSWGSIVQMHIDWERGGQGPRRDFIAFYTAAILARADPGKVYDPEAQIEFQKTLSNGPLEGIHWHYLYPPFFTAALLPLGYLSYIFAYGVWTGLTIALYLLSIILLSRLYLENRRSFWLAVAIAVAAPSFQWLLITGQTTAIGLFLWTLGLYFVKQGRGLFAGIVLGVLSYRVQYLALLAPLLLIKRASQVISGMGISFVALGAIGAMVFSFSSYLEYAHVLGNFSQRIADELQPLSRHASLYGFFRPLFSHGWALTLTIATSAMLVWWVAKAWRGALRVRSGSFDLQFAMLVVSSLLLMHHSLVYDLLLITIPAFLVYSHRSLFPPYYKILLALIYLSPYILMLLLFTSPVRINPIQPLLFWLCFEIYRACVRDSERDKVSEVAENRVIPVPA